MENLIMEAVLDTDVDINSFFSGLPKSSKERCMRVSIAVEFLLKEVYGDNYDSELPAIPFQLRQAVLFYDVGFSLIPERLLNKKEELTAAEFRVLERHCRYGAKLLERHHVNRHCTQEEKKFWKLATETALSHHERWDGKGYPFGLLTTATPIVSRAVALIDAYDAIVSGSMHRMALPHEYAVLEISDNSGTQFDPNLADVFIKNNRAFREIFSMKLSTSIWETYTI